MSDAFTCASCQLEIKPDAPKENGETQQIACPRCGDSHGVRFAVLKDSDGGTPRVVHWSIVEVTAG